MRPLLAGIIYTIFCKPKSLFRTSNGGITLSKSILQTIDQRRGDIPRSRYIRRAIERYLSSKDIDKVAAAAKTRRK
jgi:hypothetical protein